MSRLIALCIFIAIVSGPVFALGYEGDYEELFYPNGMPVYEGYFGAGPSVYNYYDEAEIPAENLLFILFAEEKDTSELPENVYITYIALVNKSGPELSDLSVITKIDVTEYIDIGMEVPGAVSELGGGIDIIPLTNELNVLHLSIAGRLSGSGSALSLSDVFFLIDTANNSLSPILELLGTATYVRSGREKMRYSYTNIYTVSNEKTGTQILIQDYKYELDRRKDPIIDQGILSPDVNVYQYDFDNNKYLIVDTIPGIPVDASLIERAVTLNTECTSGCYE